MNSDRLNPMVIKELRQGLKSRSFIATFLGLQGLMVLSMFIYLAAVTAGNGNLSFADGFFWFMLGIMLILFMPLRAFQALHDEVKNDTLELLFLTRMNAWKITFGKWCALVIQIFLLVSAVLPYLCLRYFLGSIDVAANLQQLFYQIVFSMIFVSIGVGLSGWTSKIMRGILILGALFALYMVLLMMFELGMGRGSSRFMGIAGWLDVVVALVVAGVIMMFFIQYGASLIAPPAENHAVRKRSMALLLTFVLGAYASYEDRPEALVICMALLLPFAIDALCEPLIGIPSVYVRLKKLRFLRWFFYPGWASGYLFVTVLMFSQLGLIYLLESDEDVWAFGLVAYNSLMMPFMLIRLIPVLSRKPLVSFFSLQALSLGFCLLLLFLEEIHFIADYKVWGNFVPLLGFFVLDAYNFDFTYSILIPVTLGIQMLIFVAAHRPFRQMQVLSRGDAR